MQKNLDVFEYRYLDDDIRKNREAVLKKYLIENDSTNIKFYDLDMYQQDLNLSSRVLAEFNRSLITPDIILNRYQIEILDILKNNNLFLSAPTSFGKTFLMLEFIKRNKETLKNIIFIIPTLALMNELLKKIYDLFSDEYNICINSSEEFKEKNIFVFVPERSDGEFLSKVKEIKIDFLVFDEIYKLQAANTREIKTDDRLIYMNKVYLDLISKSEKIALLGPYINNVTFEKTKPKIVKYFTNFLPVYNNIKVLEDDDVWLNYVKNDKQLIYFKSPGSIYRNIDKIVDRIPEDEECIERYKSEIYYLCESISEDWYVVSLLKRGIGIHHGKTPMFLRKFYENEYNKGNIKILLCTNTLMEGINTPTESLIIVDDPGSAFKLNNLIGRVGRLNVKSPVVGEIIISNFSIYERLLNTSGWFELKILAENDEIVSDDEIIYLDKKYENENKQHELDKKINLINSYGVTIDDIVNKNLQFSSAYNYLKNKYFEKFENVEQLHDFVELGIELIRGPSYLFDINRYEDLNYQYSYLPYKYYLCYLILGLSYKNIVELFNNKINVSRKLSNTNVFIDSLYELNNFIKFKFSKLVKYIELYETDEIKQNKNLQKFIGILSNYKNFETVYKILDDLGINEEDSRKIIEILNVANITSTSNIIKLIRQKKNVLLEENLSPFTLNNIKNI